MLILGAPNQTDPESTSSSASNTKPRPGEALTCRTRGEACAVLHASTSPVFCKPVTQKISFYQYNSEWTVCA